MTRSFQSLRSNGLKNRETGEENLEDVTLSKDEGNRPGTTAETLGSLKPVVEGGVITAGNASQLSDGASACVLMEGKMAEQQGLTPLGSIAVWQRLLEKRTGRDGCRPIYAIPKTSEEHRSSHEDIGLWELNEAFACQVLYCRDHLGIDPEIYNVNGGAISIGHPYGMTGARQVGHALLEGRRRGVKYAGHVHVCWRRHGRGSFVWSLKHSRS